MPSENDNGGSMEALVTVSLLFEYSNALAVCVGRIRLLLIVSDANVGDDVVVIFCIVFNAPLVNCKLVVL